MSEQAHAILGASSYYRWKACPGSVRLSRDLPPAPPSEAADEGTRVHDLCAKFVTGDLSAEEFWAQSDEVRESLLLYSGVIQEDYLGRKFPVHREVKKGLILVEQKLDLSSIWPGCFGTADCVAWKPDEALLRIYDYKNGKSVVEAERNLQMMYYALAAIVDLKYPAKVVEVVIVQPRAAHKNGQVRRFKFQAYELIDFQEEFVADCRRTEDPNAPLVEGRHCFFCPAKQICPVRHEQRIADAQRVFSPVVENDFFGEPAVDFFS